MVRVLLTPAILGVVPVIVNLVAANGLTTQEKGAGVVIPPCVAATAAVSALYNTITGLTVPEAKVSEVALPKAVPPTVGAVTGLGELFAPENVNDLAPV